jgi:hypothetical protein
VVKLRALITNAHAYIQLEVSSIIFMKKSLISLVILIIAAGVVYYLYQQQQQIKNISSFEECGKKYPVMDSYPGRCVTPDGRSFTQEIGNELELHDLILISNPRPNQKITSPLKINGTARGTWFFEASFPIKLVDEQGKTIAESHGEAKGEWMTEDFVPYEATLEFKTNAKRGTLILEKDNPSGLSENDNQLEVPVVF